MELIEAAITKGIKMRIVRGNDLETKRGIVATTRRIISG
jgi:hypothetical protein